jgi:hypothetical protein
MFIMNFQGLMGPKNQGVMVPSGTTQGNFYPMLCMEMTKTLMCFVV